MEFNYCPDCGGSEPAEDSTCQKCRNPTQNGKKRTLKSKSKTSESRGRQVSVGTKKIAGKNLKKIISLGSVGLLFLLCLAVFSHYKFFSANVKNLKTINSQLFTRNDQNKFAVETNEKKNLTAITLTQKNIKLQSGDNPSLDIKLLYDCVIEGDALTGTPDEYHITILSNEADRKIFEATELKFETDKNFLTLKKQDEENKTNETESFGYATFHISRKDLETIADSTRIAIQIGEYTGQINFAAQQSIKSFLIATSIDSKVS